ncbi:MAG: DUF2065 family protein [gamma proteobacterium symbiont of Lucinoma myriamae]|nr:DUF2065 family protein [gamma proteobacterium symbiont of Lucinoma myriamae]MCU7819811.1 DUF2065 family protein [gamma proteobacterium symbiont of Lucinoma myriamae]MCU7831581.1 DUF2065 family protein [gamma proteobacterium symbiont of Lucinoma myriamae]
MWNEILIAGALMLVLEGLLPILNPKLFKQMMFNASQMSEQQLRWTGIISMVIGAIAIYVLKH